MALRYGKRYVTYILGLFLFWKQLQIYWGFLCWDTVDLLQRRFYMISGIGSKQSNYYYGLQVQKNILSDGVTNQNAARKVTDQETNMFIQEADCTKLGLEGDLEKSFSNSKGLDIFRGGDITAMIKGEKKAPYSHLADENGMIHYEGVTFICDNKKQSIALGDMSNSGDVLSIPLSGGGTLKVNRDNIDQLSKAIGMFSPEDINVIMRAIAQDSKAKKTLEEIDEMVNNIGDTKSAVEKGATTENAVKEEEAKEHKLEKGAKGNQVSDIWEKIKAEMNIKGDNTDLPYVLSKEQLDY